MRRLLNIFNIILITFFLIACGHSNHSKDDLLPTDVVRNPNTASGEVNNNELPVIEFDRTTHDFGKMIQGEIVTYGFKFKNTGKSDLLISRVSTSCGCTASEYPRKPIKPGEEGVIKIRFDSKGRKGVQRKSATVQSNTQPSRKTLTIKAVIFLPEEE